MSHATIATHGWRHATALMVTLAMWPVVAVRALALVVGPEDVDRAMRIGRDSDVDRSRFHARYIVGLTDATVQQLEVLTEFRRVALDVEQRLHRGDHMFGVDQVTEAVQPWRGKVTLVVRLRFHPQNVLVSVPPYEIAVGEPSLEPLDTRRMAISAILNPGQKRGTGTPLYGAVVEADFDAARVGQRTRTVTVMLDEKEIARATINFAQIE